MGLTTKDAAKESSASTATSSAAVTIPTTNTTTTPIATSPSATSNTSTPTAATTTTSSSPSATAPGSSDSSADKYKKFENDGVVFKAKLIGSELVMEPRGDKMCQNSIQRLKAIIKGTNSHKKRIVLKISYQGVKVFDEKTNEILHHHEVSQISYIASDETDNRSFGYVSDVPNKAHQFICFKTSGPAINVMSVLSALFEAVQERTKQAEKAKETAALEGNKEESSSSSTAIKQQDTIDLIGGDSGILDIDGSLISDDKITPSAAHLPASFHAHHPIPQFHQQQQQHHLHHHLQHQPTSSSLLDNSLASPSNSFSSITGGNKQSASSDLIFSDLFSGLSDPIIVDKNDSLISYKPDFSSSSANAQLIHHHQALGGSMNAGIGLGSSAGGGGGGGSGLGGLGSSGSGAGLPFNIPPPHPHRSISMAAASGANQASARPIPRRQNSTGQQQHHSAVLPPPSSLPRPAPMMMSSSGPASHNRSLVYNHSSVSLSDAALTHQSSFNSTTSSTTNTTQNDSYVDRYAVFNDINNLPSIFESASLGSSMNNINNSNSNNSNTIGTNNSNNNSNNIFNTINRPGSSTTLLQPTLSSSGGMTGSGSTNAMMMMGSSQQQASSSLGTASSMMMPTSNLSYGNSNNNIGSNSSNKMSQPCIFRQTNPFDDDFFA